MIKHERKVSFSLFLESPFLFIVFWSLQQSSKFPEIYETVNKSLFVNKVLNYGCGLVKILDLAGNYKRIWLMWP